MVPEVAFVLPVVRGQEQQDLNTLAEMDSSRHDEYEQALRSAGIKRHTVWHQKTPDGTFAIVLMEVDDPAGITAFASSNDPFNQWFRQQMQEVHGLDIAQSSPDVEMVHDVRV
jgi:hypothetical protein